MIEIDEKVLSKALQLSSGGKRPTYERLEFLGDRVIGLVVAEVLYQKFPKEDEGAMAKRFVALTREETLADIARSIGLPALIKQLRMPYVKMIRFFRMFVKPLWRRFIWTKALTPFGNL